MNFKELHEGAEPKMPGAPKGISIMTPQQFVAKSAAGEEPQPEEGVAEGSDENLADLSKIKTDKLQQLHAMHRHYGQTDPRSKAAAQRGAEELKKRGVTVPVDENQGVAEGSNNDYRQGVDDGVEYFLYTDGEGDTIKDVFLQMKRSATEPKSEKYWRGVVDGMKSVQSEEQVEQGVAEGSETAADIDKKIEFHKQGQAAAQYKGSMNKMHAAKIRELEAKKQVLKQGVAEGLDKQALQKELIIINKLIKDMKNSWQQQHLLQKKQELLKQLKQGVAEADIIGFRRSADAISKQKVWQSSAASDSKQDDKTFSYQGYTINFTPDKLNIYLGGDLVLSRKGNFANPTKMQLVAARGNIGKIIDDKRRAALIRSVIQKNKGIQGVAEEKCPHCNGPMVSEELINEKKDACYYKVKSRYKVWPSAYASGALVKCRNKGANNWGNGGKKNESSILEGIEQADESLHDWFNKEKWVRMDTKGNIKGPCAKEPGEGKPKCLPQAKAHSLGKKGRASAAARKRREDPNPDRSGKAINVNTKKTKG